MLTDSQAVQLRGAVSDLGSGSEALDDFDRQAIEVSLKQLQEYERNAVAEKRVPYQQAPRITLENLDRLEGILDGDGEVFGAGYDTPELRSDTVAVSYLSTKFQKAPEDIYSNFEGYKRGLQEYHKTDSFESALRLDIQSTRDRNVLIQDAYDAAFRSAVRSDSVLDSFSAFTKGKEGTEIPPELVQFYGEAFKEARSVYAENQDDFESFADSMKKAVSDVEVFSQADFLNTVASLSRIDPKLRGLAFTYLEESLKESGSIKKAFEGRMGELFRQMANVTPGELAMRSQAMVKAIENGQDITVSAFGDRPKGMLQPEAEAALQISSFSSVGRGNYAFPGWRFATPEEKAQKYAEAQSSGEFARALLDVEAYVRGTLATADYDSGFMRGLMEKVMYPASRMSADMLLFVGAAAGGRKMGNVTGGTLGMNPAIMGEISAMSASLRSMSSGLKSEHFEKLIRQNPDIDIGAAYEMANISGNTAATLETLSMNVILSKLPGVRSLLQSWRGTGFRSASTAFLANAGQSIGTETLTELAQDYTADLTQQIFAAFDESIPNANLGQAFVDTIKEAPDIALAVLPYALLGGGHSAYVNAQTQKALLANTEALQTLGFEEKDILEIQTAETLAQKLQLFSEKYSVEKAVTAMNAAIDSGKDISAFLSPDDASAIAEAGQESETRQEPLIVPRRNEQGVISEWEVTTPEGNSEVFQSQQDAIERAGQWYDENGVEGLISPNDQGGKHSARAGTRNEAPVSDNAYAPENEMEPEASKSFSEMGMPNAGTRVLDDPTQVDPKTGKAKGLQTTQDAPVNAVQVLNAFTDVIKATGLSGAIRTGRLRGKGMKRALGVFYVREQIIRIRTANDVETSAHEAGHAFEDGIFGAAHDFKKDPKVPTKALNELITLGQAIYPQEPHNGWGSEGFAEFFRLFMTDPDQAAQKAPTFAEHFQGILKSMPDVQKRVQEAQAVGTQYLRQGSFKRAQGSIAQQPSTVQKTKEAALRAAQDFERQFIESAAVVRKFVQEANEKLRERGKAEVPDEANPYYTLTARRLTADSVVDYMAREGMLNFAGQKVGRPLTDVFRQVEGQVEEFVVYLYAKRALALWTDGKGRNPGITFEDAQTIIGEVETPVFQQAAQNFYDWHNGVLDYAAESSPDYAQAVEKIRQADPGFYIPLQREFDAVTQRYLSKGGGVKGKDLVQRLKGSGRRIKDPVESSLAQAKQIVQKAHQKAILDQITKIADSVPGLGHMIFEVNRDMQTALRRDLRSVVEQVSSAVSKAGGVLEVSAGRNPEVEQLKKNLEKFEKDGTYTPEQIAEIRDKIRYIETRQNEEFSDALDEEVMTFFAPAIVPNNKGENPIMPIYSNGKLRWFEMDRGLYEAFNGMDMVKMGPALDLVLGLPARTFRLGTTGLNAGFSLVTNPIRDFRTLMLNSQASASTRELFGLWLGSMRDLMVHAFTNGRISSEWIDLFNRLGVKMAQPLGQDTRPMKRAARRVKKGGKFTFFDTTDYIREIFQFTESAARIAEIKAVAKDIGYDFTQPLTAGIAAKLANAGKTVTTDFTKAGKLARQLNQAIPFFNAAIQGPVAHAQAIQRDPRKFALRGLMGTGLVLANWYRNKDEEWWREMPLSERYAYTYIPVGNELIRIPRAFEADGLFMAGAEALADAWYAKEPEEAAKWFGKWLGGFVPSMMPVLPKMAAEQLANENFFYQSPIVPRSQQDLYAEEQYSPYTTKVAIKLGEIFNLSPRRIEHGIRSIFGGVSIDVLALLGRGDGNLIEQEFEPSDLPALGRLFQRGGQEARSPKSVEALYDAYADAIKLQRSDKKEETDAERKYRILLTDAVRQISLLSDIQHATKSREKRNQIESVIIEISKDAVNQSATRGQLKQAANQFKE